VSNKNHDHATRESDQGWTHKQQQIADSGLSTEKLSKKASDISGYRRPHPSQGGQRGARPYDPETTGIQEMPERKATAGQQAEGEADESTDPTA
jgi:hypothetical protein